jgi:broad specificity phosphatase PhoE
VKTSTRWLALVLVSLTLAPALSALETIYIIRHAEKDRTAWWDDPAVDRFRPLSDQGRQRAQLWAKHLETADLAAIYTSETSRTVNTGAPLARTLGIPLFPGSSSADESTMGDFLHGLSNDHRDDKAVLLVGHSNTIPQLLRALGARRKCFSRLGFVPEGDLIEGNDGLWIIKLGHRGCKQIKRQTVLLR